MRRQSARLLFAFPLVLSLFSCGGGSSNGDSTPIAFPVDAAISSIYSSGRNFSMTYRDGSDTYVITLNSAPGGDTSFEGLAAKTTSTTITSKKNESVVSTASAAEYFQVSPYHYLGSLDSDGSYEVASSHKNLPQTATIGASGDYYTSTTYSDSTKSTVTDITVVTWSLEADPTSKSNAYLCETHTENPEDITKLCYRINESGSVLGAKLTFRYPDGTSITFK